MHNSDKIIVGSTQIHNGFAGQHYLPYSIGILQAHILHNSKKKERYDFRSTIYKRELLNDCAKKLKDCQIILFSTYVWNERISLAVAKEAKKNDPNKFIVFGGPSVPDNIDNKTEKFLRKNFFIDVCVHQEGERTILQLLDNYPDTNFELIPNISYLDKNNKFVNNKNIPRLKSFENTPSPYLYGVFDKLIKENPQETWIASWETNRGCPFSCAYCDWGSAINSKVARMELDRIFKDLDWFSKNKIEFIFCCDANFGILPRDYEIAIKAAENRKKYGYPKVLSVQDTKNARERAYKVQKLLAENNLSHGVTLAMQSADLHTLKEIKRDNISIANYQELQRRFTKDGIPTYTELILGLPGETYESFTKGVSDVIQAGQHNRIKFNNLSLLPNAEIASSEYVEKNKIFTKETTFIYRHGSLDEKPVDGINEKQKLVISTKTMPTKDWIKTNTYASISEFFYFNKVLQIPLLFKHKLNKKSFKFLFEDLMSLRNKKQYKVIESVVESLYEHANSITRGGYEFKPKKDWLDIFWPPGEFEYINILKNNMFDEFFEEAKHYFLSNSTDKNYNEIINECLILNKKMMRLPFETKDVMLSFKFNILECYNLILQNLNYNLKKEQNEKLIIKSDFTFNNWNDWMREVIWYGHRSGKYTCRVINSQRKITSSELLINTETRGLTH